MSPSPGGPEPPPPEKATRGGAGQVGHAAEVRGGACPSGKSTRLVVFAPPRHHFRCAAANYLPSARPPWATAIPPPPLLSMLRRSLAALRAT